MVAVIGGSDNEASIRAARGARLQPRRVAAGDRLEARALGRQRADDAPARRRLGDRASRARAKSSKAERRDNTTGAQPEFSVTQFLENRKIFVVFVWHLCRPTLTPTSALSWRPSRRMEFEHYPQPLCGGGGKGLSSIMRAPPNTIANARRLRRNLFAAGGAPLEPIARPRPRNADLSPSASNRPLRARFLLRQGAARDRDRRHESRCRRSAAARHSARRLARGGGRDGHAHRCWRRHAFHR